MTRELEAQPRAAALWGIDVSKYQGEINWRQVAAAGVQFAFVRTGWGGYAGGIEEGYDPRFVQNITGARAAGIPVGAYLYSYMNTPAAAHAAAESMMRLVEPFRPEYPLVLDFEDSATYAALGANRNTAIVRTFLEDLEQGGYYAMLYTYTNFANNYLNMRELARYDVWISDYRSAVGYRGSYGIWQYSNHGHVNGIATPVDLDHAYQNYPAIIRRAGLNRLTVPQPVMLPLQNAELQVFGQRNCEFFTAPDVYQIGGSLANGRYKAIAVSSGPFDGFDWVMLLMGGSVWWTALLDDRCRLVGGRADSHSALWEEERYLEELVEHYRQENTFLRCRLDTAETQLCALQRILALPTRECSAAFTPEQTPPGECESGKTPGGPCRCIENTGAPCCGESAQDSPDA